MRISIAFGVLVAIATLSSCASPPPPRPPAGPTVAVLPGINKPIESFRQEDMQCRGNAMQQVASGGGELQKRYDAAYQKCMYSKGNPQPFFVPPPLALPGV